MGKLRAIIGKKKQAGNPRTLIQSLRGDDKVQLITQSLLFSSESKALGYNAFMQLILVTTSRFRCWHQWGETMVDFRCWKKVPSLSFSPPLRLEKDKKTDLLTLFHLRSESVRLEMRGSPG